MSYADNYNLTKVYWKNYVDKYMEVYKHVYNQMKEIYEDEQALASAVATTMIAFTKAAGMDMAGIVTWDETAVESEPEFRTFAEHKSSGGFQKSGGEQKPSGGFQKRPYNGPTELKGPASEKQVNIIHEFLTSNDAKVQKVVVEALEKIGVAAPEELSKQDASNIIQAGYDAKPKKSFYGKK
jgi:hypothetical protein